MLKKGKLIPLIFSGVTAAAVSLATVSCSFEQNPLTIEGPYEYMVETGGKIQPKTDYDPYKVELHEAQVKTGVTMSINPISYIGDEVWDYIAINEEGYLYTKDGFTADEPRTLTFTVHAEYKDEKENKNYECDSAIVSIAIVEPSGKQATIEGGESYVPLKYGRTHTTTTPFTMLVNDELQSGVTFTKEKINPTDPDIPSGIGLRSREIAGYTEAVLDVANTTPVGEYTFKVQGKITPDGDDEIVASANVTVVISENEYVMSGGSTSLELFAGDAGSDSGVWKLEKDGDDITDSAVFKFDVPPGPTWIYVGDGTGTSTKNKVYWNDVPNETSAPDSVTLIAEVGDERVAEIEIPISVKEPFWGFEIQGDDVITDQVQSSPYTCALHKDPTIPDSSVSVAWYAVLSDDPRIAVPIDSTGIVTPNPSQDDFDILVWPVITITLPSGKTLTFNDGGLVSYKTVNVIPPYQAESATGTTGTYCWGDLDGGATVTPEWWLLDESEAADFSFTRVGSSAASTVTRAAFNSPIYFGKDRKVVDTNKLNGAAAFNSDITFPSNPFAIGDDFLLGCTIYNTNNKDWRNFRNCTNIGNSFMYGCSATTAMMVPESVVSVGLDFMVNCYSLVFLTIECPVTAFNQDSDMTLTVDNKTCTAAQSGVTILSDDATVFESMFPEISVSAVPDLGYYRHYKAS